MPNAGDVPELEELYDARTLAALDAGRGEPPPARWQPTSTRARWGSLLVGTVLGLQEVLDPRPEREEVELRPDDSAAAERWVTFVHVPGAPRASRILVRPWLAPGP